METLVQSSTCCHASELKNAKVTAKLAFLGNFDLQLVCQLFKETTLSFNQINFIYTFYCFLMIQQP